MSAQLIGNLIIDYNDLTPSLARAGCFVINMPNDAYHDYEGISVSGLKQVMQSPAHYAYAEPKEKTTFMILGTAIHCAVLEPVRYANEYCRLEECKDRRQAQYKDAVKALGEDLVLITSDAQKVENMQAAVQRNESASKQLADGWAELSGFVECPKTGVLLRVRFDFLTPELVSIDLKKTQDARQDAFSKSILNYGYHVQAAFYNDVFKLITGQPLKAFKFLAIEEKSPHANKMHKCDDVSMHIGRELYKPALELYAKCEANNEWPAYSEDEDETGIPTWAVNHFLDEEGEQDG